MILLDTCAAVWMATADPSFGKDSRTRVERASARQELFVSAVTAWEIATLARLGRLALQISPKAFVDQIFLHPGIIEVPVDAEIAFAAGSLPGELRGDPADRLIVATAIAGGLQVMTRDSHILDYAKRTGAVPAMPC